MVLFSQILTSFHNSIKNAINSLTESKKNFFIVLLKFFIFNLVWVISYIYYSFDPIFNLPLSTISTSVFFNILNNFSKYFDIYCQILQFLGEEIGNFLSMAISNKLLRYYLYCFDFVKRSFALLININTEDFKFCTWKLFSTQLNLFLISFFPLLVFIQYFTSKVIFVIFNCFAFLFIILYNLCLLNNKIKPIFMEIANLLFRFISMIFDIIKCIVGFIPKFILLCFSFYFFRVFFKAYLQSALYSLIFFVIYCVYQFCIEKISSNKLNYYSITWMFYFLHKKIIVLAVWWRFFSCKSVYQTFSNKSNESFNLLQLIYLFIQIVRIVINVCEICSYVYKGESKRIRSEEIIAAILFPI